MPARIGLTAALLALALASPADARAAEGDGLTGASWRTLEVGVLPVVSYLSAGDTVFATSDAPEPLVSTWQGRLEAALGTRDLVSVVTPAEAASIIARLPAHHEGITVARERYQLGLHAYQALEVNDAIAHLERSARLFDDAYADLSHASEMAEVALYRGLASMERGDVNHAHIAFRRMWLLDPGRVFERGYYPESTEKALLAALADLAAMPDLSVSRYPGPRLEALAQRTGVDAWVVALIVGTRAAPVLRLSIWDARTRAVVEEERIPLADPARAADLLDRAISAWHTCAVSSTGASFVREREAHAFYIDVDFTHVLWLRHPRTRELFPGPGASLGVTWEANDFLQGWFQISHTASVPDQNRDLVDTFVMSRVGLGAGLTGGTRDLRVYLRAGLETAVSFSDIEMTTDADCKHFRTDHWRCTQLSKITAPGIWFGFVFGTGLRWAFLDRWYLHLHTELSSYVANPVLIGDLNFPFAVSLGLGHRF